MKSRIILLLLFATGWTVQAAAQTNSPPKTKGSNFGYRPGTPLKVEKVSLEVHRDGDGSLPVLLITGHMQDESFYEGFIRRNKHNADFHVVIPPGMAGTAAYPWPEESEEFASRPWTSTVEQELVEYVDENLDIKPIIVANWYTGMESALNIASDYPGKLKGLLLVGRAGRSPFYRWYDYDPGGSDKLFDVATQREQINKFITFWRTVSEYTWHNNSFPAEFYSVDPLKGAQVIRRNAKTPIPIAMRYYIKYMVDDLS